VDNYQSIRVSIDAERAGIARKFEENAKRLTLEESVLGALPAGLPLERVWGFPLYGTVASVQLTIPDREGLGWCLEKLPAEPLCIYKGYSPFFAVEGYDGDREPGRGGRIEGNVVWKLDAPGSTRPRPYYEWVTAVEVYGRTQQVLVRAEIEHDGAYVESSYSKYSGWSHFPREFPEGTVQRWSSCDPSKHSYYAVFRLDPQTLEGTPG
jgi:hypothetical protein